MSRRCYDRTMVDVKGILTARSREVETAIVGAMDHLKGEAPARLIEAMTYSLMAGGKRLRPALVLEWFDGRGGD
jgi:geranylgeranyl diphosphate synthase, type II